MPGCPSDKRKSRYEHTAADALFALHPGGGGFGDSGSVGRADAGSGPSQAPGRWAGDSLRLAGLVATNAGEGALRREAGSLAPTAAGADCAGDGPGSGVAGAGPPTVHPGPRRGGFGNLAPAAMFCKLVRAALIS